MPNPLHYIIEALDPAKHRREEFDCGVPALNDFLRNRARKEMAAGASACFVIVPEDDPGCIAGFYTLSAAVIVRTDLPEAVTKKLPRYLELPATLPGRLARKLVNDSRIVQISGKILTASNSTIVGPTNSQAMVRSDSPRTRRAKVLGVALAARIIGELDIRISRS